MNIIDFLIPLTPWRNSAIPEGALLITKKERDREEEAIRCLKEFAECLKAGQTDWSQAERDKAQEMMEKLGPKCLIGDQRDQTASQIVEQILSGQTGREAYIKARQMLWGENTLSNRYQDLLDLVKDKRSDQEKRQELYSAFKKDPVAMLVCVSHPIKYLNKESRKKAPYRLAQYVFEDKNAWQELVQMALDYKTLTLEDIAELSAPIIEKALFKNIELYYEESKEHRESIYETFIQKAKYTIESNHISAAELDRSQFLHYNAKMGNLSFVKDLIEEKEVDVNYSSNEDQKTGLYYAASHNHFEIAEYLIQKGANVNHPDSDGRTPLYMAANHKNTNIVKLLLANGANPNLPTRLGRVALHRAVIRNSLSNVLLLIQANANVDPPTQNLSKADLSLLEKESFTTSCCIGCQMHYNRYDHGGTPLYLAQQKGNFAISRILLQSGASIFFKKKNLLNNQEQVTLRPFHSKLHSTLRGILKNLNLPLEGKDSDEYSDALLRFTLKAARKAYSRKRLLRCIHGILLEKTKLFPKEDLHAKNLFILIRHLMFLCYGLHPLKAPSWPQELQVNIENPPKDVKEFSTWAEQFIGILVTQKEFDFTWAKLERLAQFPIEIIENYLLFAWRNHAVSEIEEVIPKKLHNYMKHDQYRFFVESRINVESKSDELETWFQKGLPLAP